MVWEIKPSVALLAVIVAGVAITTGAILIAHDALFGSDDPIANDQIIEGQEYKVVYKGQEYMSVYDGEYMVSNSALVWVSHSVDGERGYTNGFDGPWWVEREDGMRYVYPEGCDEIEICRKHFGGRENCTFSMSTGHISRWVR